MGLSVLNIVTPHNKFEAHVKRFIEEMYPQNVISETLPFERVQEYNDYCSMFLTGSDQIWQHREGRDSRYEKFFRLDFADESKRKVSFSTSFGAYNHEDKKLQEEFRKLFERYSSISTREDIGVDILKRRYGIHATQIMEPVFNVEPEVFYELAEHSQMKEEKEPYLLTYILDPSPDKKKAIQFYAKKMGIRTVNILDGFAAAYDENKERLGLPGTLPNIWCADFIKYFVNASFVITDSFHGTAFAVIFNKAFISIANYGRGIERFNSLLDKINMKDRLVDNKNIPEDEKYLYHMNFSYANAIIAKERKRAIIWLKDALFSEKLPDVKLKNRITTYLEKDMCTGCGACVSICPCGAIETKGDEFGVYRAYIDEYKCTNCGMCVKSCAALELPTNLNSQEPLSYAFVCEDEEMLMKSSSGGASPVFAQEIIRRGGVVFGAAWKDDFTVEHIIVENEADLNKLQKSKYLQSYLGNTFSKVKDFLQTGRTVLFVGLPCQVAGLKKFLGRTYLNLIMVDMLCANIVSTKFFKKYLDETYGIENVQEYTSRYKQNNIWNGYTLKVTKRDGTTDINVAKHTDNYQAMYHSLSMRSTQCGKCKYQGLPRYGDVTIGDCWGIEKYDASIDAKKGVSAVLVNNDKGEKFLNSIPESEIAVLKAENLNEMKKYNVCAFQKNRKWPISPKREKFFEMISENTFAETRNEVDKVIKA